MNNENINENNQCVNVKIMKANDSNEENDVS